MPAATAAVAGVKCRLLAEIFRFEFQVYAPQLTEKWRKRVGVELAKTLITKEILWNQPGFPIKTLTSAGG
jgi:hypothetical protein